MADYDALDLEIANLFSRSVYVQVTDVPDDPDDPDHPPVDPDEPDEPDKPDEPDTPNVPDDPKIPQTGQLWWPAPILALGGLMLSALGWIRRKKWSRRNET